MENKKVVELESETIEKINKMQKDLRIMKIQSHIQTTIVILAFVGIVSASQLIKSQMKKIKL